MNTPMIYSLDAGELLHRVAETLPAHVTGNVVIIGSIAAAWAFRDVARHASVATKDIDMLIHPGVDAVVTAQTIGQQLLDDGWQPTFPNGIKPGTDSTPADQLPVLSLTPPNTIELWFIELLAEPAGEQVERKHWERLVTDRGVFGLPSFRYMGVTIYDAERTEFGVSAARPACMALANLLEHAVPDRTPISNLPGRPARYLKDVGRAVSLWWLSREQSVDYAHVWDSAWRGVLQSLYPGRERDMLILARDGLISLRGQVEFALEMARMSVLAGHQVTIGSWTAAHDELSEFLTGLINSET